jgi:hypothetical protein
LTIVALDFTGKKNEKIQLKHIEDKIMITFKTEGRSVTLVRSRGC